MPKKRLGKYGQPIQYKSVQCRGCGEMFQPHASRHWTCPECSEDSTLKTRVYRYGMAGRAIKDLFSERNGLCVLCDRPATDIDHDHQTGKVRGVLCHGCNLAISRVEIEGWIEKALGFIQRGKNEKV